MQYVKFVLHSAVTVTLLLHIFLVFYLQIGPTVYFYFLIYSSYQQRSRREGAGAGGCYSLPIGLKGMQNWTFLVLLRPIFAPKMKTAPQRDWRAKVVKDLLLLEFCFFSGAHPKLVRKSEWILVKSFFFSEITRFRPKKPFQFRWRPFFCFVRRSPDFDRKTASIWFKIDENLGQVPLLLFQASKKPHPLCEIVATRLVVTEDEKLSRNWFYLNKLFSEKNCLFCLTDSSSKQHFTSSRKHSKVTTEQKEF